MKILTQWLITTLARRNSTTCPPTDSKRTPSRLTSLSPPSSTHPKNTPADQPRGNPTLATSTPGRRRKEERLSSSESIEFCKSVAASSDFLIIIYDILRKGLVHKIASFWLPPLEEHFHYLLVKVIKVLGLHSLQHLCHPLLAVINRQQPTTQTLVLQQTPKLLVFAQPLQLTLRDSKFLVGEVVSLDDWILFDWRCNDGNGCLEMAKAPCLMSFIARDRTVRLSTFAAFVFIIAVAHYALHSLLYKLIRENQQHDR